MKKDKTVINGEIHDEIDCCWSAIYGLGCDKGKKSKKEAKKIADYLHGLRLFLFPNEILWKRPEKFNLKLKP